MNIRRLVPIIIGVVLVAFGIGLFSLKYNDKHKFINPGSEHILNIESSDGNVNVGKGGIEIHDGDDHVSIGWNGINISDGEDHVSIGWNGINVKEGNKSKFKFGNRENFFSFNSPKQISYSVEEERFEDISDINNISISSSFVKIKVKSQDRDDIRIHYHGNMRANMLPELKVETQSGNIDIKLENPNIGGYTVGQSDVVLEIFVPESFNGSFIASASSGSISMEDLTGRDFHISSSSGSQKLENIQGTTISLSSSSGSQKLENIQGDTINLASSSGSIKAEDCIGNIKASASSGSVLLDNEVTSGNIEVSTSSGSVNLKLPDDASYKIKGSSSSGRYSSNINMNIEQNEKGNFKATIGSGEKSIDIRTSSGSVKFSN